MRRCFLVLWVVIVLTSCGDDAPGTEGEGTTPSSVDELVVESRQITEAELVSLGDDDGHAPLACEDYGSAQWDYGPVSDTSEGGRAPEDALADAVSDLNRDSPVVPATGWTELVVDDASRVFVVDRGDGDFVAAVKVNGQADRGIWRHFEAFTCPLDDA